MAASLRLDLTFEPLEEMWLQHPAALLLDLQALYFAARAAERTEQSLLPFYREEERLLLAQTRGSMEDLLAEAEYLNRAGRRLEIEGADPELWRPLRDSAQFVAHQIANGVYMRPVLPRAERRRIAPRLLQISMGSPLAVAFSIPAEYWTGGGLVLFLTANRDQVQCDRAHKDRARGRGC